MASESKVRYGGRFLGSRHNSTRDAATPAQNHMNDVATPRHNVTHNVATPRHNFARDGATPRHNYANAVATPRHNFAQNVATPRHNHTNAVATPRHNYVNAVATPRHNSARDAAMERPRPSTARPTPNGTHSASVGRKRFQSPPVDDANKRRCAERWLTDAEREPARYDLLHGVYDLQGCSQSRWWMPDVPHQYQEWTKIESDANYIPIEDTRKKYLERLMQIESAMRNLDENDKAGRAARTTERGELMRRDQNDFSIVYRWKTDEGAWRVLKVLKTSAEEVLNEVFVSRALAAMRLPFVPQRIERPVNVPSLDGRDVLHACVSTPLSGGLVDKCFGKAIATSDLVKTMTDAIVQISVALHAAQYAYNFVHGDLHYNNILIGSESADTLVVHPLRRGQRGGWILERCLEACVIDYGFACYSQDGGFHYTKCNPDSRMRIQTCGALGDDVGRLCGTFLTYLISKRSICAENTTSMQNFLRQVVCWRLGFEYQEHPPPDSLQQNVLGAKDVDALYDINCANQFSYPLCGSEAYPSRVLRHEYLAQKYTHAEDDALPCGASVIGRTVGNFCGSWPPRESLEDRIRAENGRIEPQNAPLGSVEKYPLIDKQREDFANLGHVDRHAAKERFAAICGCEFGTFERSVEAIESHLRRFRVDRPGTPKSKRDNDVRETVYAALKARTALATALNMQRASFFTVMLLLAPAYAKKLNDRAPQRQYVTPEFALSYALSYAYSLYNVEHMLPNFRLPRDGVCEFKSWLKNLRDENDDVLIEKIQDLIAGPDRFPLQRWLDLKNSRALRRLTLTQWNNIMKAAAFPYNCFLNTAETLHDASYLVRSERIQESISVQNMMAHINANPFFN